MRNPPSRSPPVPPGHVGSLLREWRAVRRLSQLDLALQADVSPRHLSCVETGKAQPSREMVSRLADALSMPLRERNALLIAAGYAPQYNETSLTTPEMTPVRQAIELILEQQEPYPAFVMNRHWDMLLTNRALARIFQVVRGGPPAHINIMRQVFDPADMRPVIGNWEEIAGELIRLLHSDVATTPSDAIARGLLQEVLAFPDIPDRWRTREVGVTPVPLLTSVFRKGDLELRFFSTLTVFGPSRDVTIDELRIECLCPVDASTAEQCRALAASHPFIPSFEAA